MESQELSVSVLVTREEYMTFVEKWQRQVRGRSLPLLTMGGALLIVLGLAGLFFGAYISLSVGSAVCVLLIGVLLACYDGLLAPLLDRAGAAREYDSKQELRMANVYVFSPKSVRVRNARVEGEVPLSLLTEWSHAGGMFLLTFGRELTLIVPQRLLEAGQAEQLERWLEDCAPNSRMPRTSKK